MTKPIEILQRPRFEGPFRLGANKAAGTATIPTGSLSVTVTDANATSGALIFLTAQNDDRGNSSIATVVEVSSIVDGTSFDIAVGGGTATTRDLLVHWLIIPIA